MDNVTIITAFTAGLLSFLSPCVLPVIPGYISLMTGMAVKEGQNIRDIRKLKFITLFHSLFFILGFTGIFVLLQLVLRGFANFIDQTILNYIFGVIVILFGLHTTGLVKLKFLYYQKSLDMGKRRGGIISAFILGVAFGFAWTPCIGPILASILALASQEKTLLQGTILLLVYSAGLGIPFLLAGFFMGAFTRFMTRYKRMPRVIEIISGLLLIFIGMLITTNRFSLLISLF